MLYAEDRELTRLFIKSNEEALLEKLIPRFPGSIIADDTLEASVKLSAEATETFLREQLAALHEKPL